MIASSIGRFSLWQRRITVRQLGLLALATAAVTAGLIVYGAWVRASGSGLGCPDWPLCSGEGTAAAIEMGHRLWAGVAMLMVLAAAVLGIMRRHEIPGPSLLLAGGALLILAQAALGGVTVLTELHGYVRLAHLGLGMGLLGLMTGAGLWLFGAELRGPPLPLRAWHLALMGAAVIMFGGSIVATQTTFDCSTLPTCDGASSTMATWLHTIHRSLAVVLALGAALTAWLMWRSGATGLALAAVVALVALVAAQIGVGVAAVAVDVPEGLRVLHVALAAMIWWTLTGLWTSSLLSSRARREPAAAAAR